jgi:ssDNA-binding Zn-finger/Zn-ribbon topoisomerase 1
MKMILYLRNTSNGVWHWRLECPDLPKGKNIEAALRKPKKSTLCKLCSNIEIVNKRRQKRHEMFEEDIYF